MAELQHLDDHTLLSIFERCEQPEIEALHRCCQRFRHIIELFILRKKCMDLLMTGIRNGKTALSQRSFRRLSYMRRLQVYANWANGRYAEHTLFRHRDMYPSYLHLDRYNLYMSHKGEIRCHERHGDQAALLRTQSKCVLGTRNSADVTCFRRKANVIFGGRDNGDMFICENGDISEERTSTELLGCPPVVANDFAGNVFVTATKEELRVWNRYTELGRSMLEPVAEFDEFYKSVCLSPNGRQLACGKYRDRHRGALQMIDLDTMTRRRLNSRTVSVYSIVWRDANSLLTASYDSMLRLFDVRSNANEMVWMDPFDSALFSLAYDGLHGVVCGMNYHCRVNLYDLRKPRDFVQMYYPTMDADLMYRGSPVYSLACDSSQLFIATDHNLRVLDFTADWAVERNYQGSPYGDRR